MTRTLVLCAALAAATGAHAAALFDGRSLTGWTPELIAANGSDTPLDRVFEAKGGVIHVYPGAPQASPQPNAILVSRHGYADFRLHVEYRWGANIFAQRLGQPRDAGILLFIGDEKPGLIETWYRWPKSLEYQIMEGDTGSAYLLKARADGYVDPATRRYLAAADGGIAAKARLVGRDLTSYKLARRDVVEAPDWNKVDIEVRGNSARFYLNGALVNEVANIVEDRPGTPIAMARGRIALQAEGAEVLYRNITVTRLDR